MRIGETQSAYCRCSGKEQYENDEEDYKNAEDFHREPAVARDVAEVLQQLHMRCLHIQLGCFDVHIDSVGELRTLSRAHRTLTAVWFRLARSPCRLAA